MIIVITPEELIQNETTVINQMFREGLDLLHVRKPFASDQEMKTFLDAIDPVFYSQCVLHSHFELAEPYGISRLHFREADRFTRSYVAYVQDYIISTSVHDIKEYNDLGKEWEYAFLSPFFPSISKKGYGNEKTVLKECEQQNNKDVGLIALGGIHEKNILEALYKGIHGVALLGAIWQSDQPVEVLKRVRFLYENHTKIKSFES